MPCLPPAVQVEPRESPFTAQGKTAAINSLQCNDLIADTPKTTKTQIKNIQQNLKQSRFPGGCQKSGRSGLLRENAPGTGLEIPFKCNDQEPPRQTGPPVGGILNRLAIHVEEMVEGTPTYRKTVSKPVILVTP